MITPNIEIEWNYFKTLDEIHADDLKQFGIILLTLVKNDEVQLVAYDVKENVWALLQN